MTVVVLPDWGFLNERARKLSEKAQRNKEQQEAIAAYQAPRRQVYVSCDTVIVFRRIGKMHSRDRKPRKELKRLRNACVMPTSDRSTCDIPKWQLGQQPARGAHDLHAEMLRGSLRARRA